MPAFLPSPARSQFRLALAVAGLASFTFAACGDEEEPTPGNVTPVIDSAVAAPFGDASAGPVLDGSANDGAAPSPCNPATTNCSPITPDGGAPSPDAGPPVQQADDCDVSFELRAYDKTSGADQFPIPMENDHYECFYFKSDVPAGQLATSLSPLLDDTRVLHHWLLFASTGTPEAPSGTHAKCDGIHPGAYLMAAWLPGTPALVLPDDVGMEMPVGPTAQFILENHYNNSARYTDSADNSGVKVCATNKPKGTHAAIHWLGSEDIVLAPNSMGSAQSTCTPLANSPPINIMGVIPHMHKLGRHAKMTILRANGSQETLHDGAFDFENQGFYAKQAVLNPGDRVTTKCDYMNNTTGFVTLGESTGNEMCYMFTLAYPVGGMNTPGPYVQGPHRCFR